MSFEEFLGHVVMDDLRLCSVWGASADVMEPGTLPEEWKLELGAMRMDLEDRMTVRVQASAIGPGGEIIADGLAGFRFTVPLAKLPKRHLNRFQATIGVGTVVPLVRAAYEELKDRLRVRAPRMGLVKLGSNGPELYPADD